MSFVNRSRLMLAAVMAALGASSVANTPQIHHRNLPDPDINVGRRKKSAGGSMQQKMRKYRQRNAAPRRGILKRDGMGGYGGCGYTAPMPKIGNHRKPNKLQMIEHIKNDSGVLEGRGVSNYMCEVLAGGWRVPLSHVIEARQRVIDIRNREFAPRLAAQRAKIIELGGDPDMDGLEFDATNDFDGVRLVRASRPVDRIPLHLHSLAG